jgi:hypothetical protein
MGTPASKRQAATSLLISSRTAVINNVGLGDAAEISPHGRCPMRDHVERYGLCQPFRRCHRAGHALRRRFYCIETRTSRLRPCPSARPGGSEGQGGRSGGGSPSLRAARRAGLHKRMTGREASGCGEARKTGETARVGAGVCRRFTLVRARGGARRLFKREKKRMGGAQAETTRGSRDRLKGQPQEGQHSAAEGRTRDRLPPASGSRATSRLVGINFAFVISSQCCACRYTACACSLSQLYCRGRHGQESEEGKEDRKGSHQEGGKEDFKEKEVVASTTERLRLRVATRTQSETSPKDMNRPLHPFGIAAR